MTTCRYLECQKSILIFIVSCFIIRVLPVWFLTRRYISSHKRKSLAKSKRRLGSKWGEKGSLFGGNHLPVSSANDTIWLHPYKKVPACRGGSFENYFAHLERDQGNYTDEDLKLSPGLQVISCSLKGGGGVQWKIRKLGSNRILFGFPKKPMEKKLSKLFSYRTRSEDCSLWNQMADSVTFMCPFLNSFYWLTFFQISFRVIKCTINISMILFKRNWQL